MRKPNSLGSQPAVQRAALPGAAAAGAGPDAQALLQQLPWGVVVLDAHNTVLRLNEQAAAWWGLPLPALKGQPLRELAAGPLPPDLYLALQRVTSSPQPLAGEFFLPQHQQWIAMTSARQGDAWVVYWQDVTVQKQLEGHHQARQAASDALLRRTEAVARTGSYELDLATGSLHFSDGMYQLFGEAPGAFEPSMAFIDGRSHAGDAAVVQQVLARAVEQRQPYYYRRRIYRADGQLRTLECHGRVACDALGQPVKLLGLLQDVTEREQAARQLLQAKDELARRITDNYVALCNAMDEGFCLLEVLFDAAERPTDYRFLDVNPVFEKQTGLRGALGQTMRGLVPAHPPFSVDAYARVARTGESTRFEAYAESVSRWFDVNAFLMKPLADRHVAVLFTDITERKRAEEALRQSEEQFRLLVMATSDAVYRMSTDWTQMEQLVGKAFLADTLSPARTWLEAYIPAGERPRVATAIADAIGRKAPFELEHRVQRADGTLGWTYSRAVPLLDERGELLEWFGTATDITARKQAEEALRQSEERLRRMMNVPHVGVLTFSCAGTLLTANDAFLDLMGYGRAELAARPFSWQDLTPPEQAAQSRQQLERVQQTGLGGPYEQEYLRRDGSRQWLMVVAAALGDGTLVEYAVDISAQKQAEADLRASEQRQRVLMESLPGAAVFVVNRELRYELAAGDALRPAGFEAAGLRGRTVRDVTPAAYWPALRDLFRQALAGRAFEYEHTQGGRSFVSRGVPLPGPAGQIDAVLAVSYDITDRKAAEEALRVSEAKYRTLFETMDQGFGIGEVLPAGPGRPADFRWLEVNPQVERLTGIPRAALLNGDTMRTVMPQMEDSWYERYEQVALTGEPAHFEQYAQVLGRWFDVFAFALEGPAPHRIALLFSNITARKQAEEDLRGTEERHRAQLEQQVAERTRALGESQARLQSVFDSATNAVVLLQAVRDAQGQLLDFEYQLANPVAQAYDGGHNPVGLRYAERHPGVHLTPIFERFAQVVATGRRADFEVHYPHEAYNHWFRLVAVKLGDGLLFTAEDISGRKLLEQGHARSLALLQQSEAVAGMGSWEYDLRTREFTWSDGLYHLLERPVGSAIKLQVFLDAVLDGDRPAAARLRRILTTGAGAFDATLRLRIGDALKTVRFKAVPLPEAPGPPERVLGVCLDVSDVVRLEAENLALKLDHHKELLLAILQAQENERQRLGEVLHNGLGQVLYATKLHLDQLDAPALHALPVLSGLYRQTGHLLADAMRQTRTLAHELVPTSLLDFGLPAALRDVCQGLSTPQLQLACYVWEEEQELLLPQPVQVTLFRLAQELAHNIVRHAGATQATLELEILPGGISLRAEDNGHGFDPQAVAEGLGLRTVRQAVALLGGTLAVDSSPKFGTHIRLRIPLPLFSQP